MKPFISTILFLSIGTTAGLAQPNDSLTHPEHHYFNLLKDSLIAQQKQIQEKRLDELKESMFRFRIDMGALDTLLENLPIPHDIEISDKAIRIDIDSQNKEWDAFTSPSKKKEREDIVKLGGDVIVNADEQVNGDVVVIGGDTQIMGRVNGGVVVIFGDAHLTSTSYIEEDVVCVWGDTQIEEGAQIEGMTTILQLGKAFTKNMDTGIFASFIVAFRFLRFILLFAFLLLIYLAFPKSVNVIRDQISAEYAKNFFVGMIGLILLPVVFIILSITILGIPIAVLILPLTVVVSFLMGGAAFCLFLGQRVQRPLGLNLHTAFLQLVVGMIILEFVPLLKKIVELIDPTLSAILLILTILIFFFAWIPGFGAVLLTRFGTIPRSHTKKSA